MEVARHGRTWAEYQERGLPGRILRVARAREEVARGKAPAIPHLSEIVHHFWIIASHFLPF